MLKPDPMKSAKMTADVDGRLRAALTYLVSDVIGQPEAATDLSHAPAAHALQAQMREAAVNDDIDGIIALYREHGAVLKRPLPDERCALVTWGADTFTDSERTLLKTAFQDDIGLTGSLVAPDPSLEAQLRASYATLRTVLPDTVPLWWAEIEALVSTVILASSGTEGKSFGGATTFGAWGAILINPVGQSDPLRLALALVHESSHQKLFYAHLDDEVVLNDPDERFSSPLRREPRPMDGIYHAAFVLARMVQFLHDLTGAPGALDALGTGVRDEAEQLLAQNIHAFDAGHDEIVAHARLTELGQQIIDEAAACVAACKTHEGQSA